MSLRMLPEALDELDAAIAYYEEQRPGLRVAFYLEVESTIALAEQNPGVGSSVRGANEASSLRTYVVRRFPFLVWTAAEGDERYVIAVAHASRRPGYWRDRLRCRGAAGCWPSRAPHRRRSPPPVSPFRRSAPVSARDRSTARPAREVTCLAGVTNPRRLPMPKTTFAVHIITTTADVRGEFLALTDEAGETPCPGGGPWRPGFDARGTLYLYGTCHRADGLTCSGYASLPDRWIPSFTCVPDAEWPVPADRRTFEASVLLGNYGAVLYPEPRDGAEFTRAARIVAPGVAVAIDVGPGRPLMVQPDAAVDDFRPGRTEPMHRRWGDLLALVEELPESRTRATLYREAGTGYAATSLPTRPCPDGADCGYRVIDNATGEFQSVLQWALPLGDDEYLLFYVLDQRPDMQHLRNAIYVARERIDRGAGTPGSPIEVACARAGSCGSGENVADCVRRWLDPTRPTASVEAFTSATTCDAIVRADIFLRLGRGCAPDGATCDGPIGIQCMSGLVGMAIDCALTGGTCALPGDGTVACAHEGCPEQAGTCDASGRAVGCSIYGIADCPAQGLSCAVNSTTRIASCVDETGVCAGQPPGASACRGDLVLTCGEAERGSPVRDCGRVALGCDATTGRCAGDGACDDDYYPRCDGAHLRYCLDGSLRDIDCADLGGSCSAEGNAHCASSGPPPMDAGTPDFDAGVTCGSAAVMGAPVPEVGIADYPTPMGGTIADGTYVLTAFEVWSASAQPYTHQETLIVHGGTYELLEIHSAGLYMSSTGSLVTAGSDLTLQVDCPVPFADMRRYSVTPTGLVILQGSYIRTYTRM